MGGDGTDNNGSRTGFAIYVQDTQYDGVCIRGYAVKSPGVVFDGTACDGQTQWFYPAAFSGWWIYQIFRVRPDGSIINAHTTSVPDSFRDPGVRRSGNGVDWYYSAPGLVQYFVTRDGVQFYGRGDTNGSARSVSGTVVRTSSSEWASGTLSDGGTTSSGYVHSPNWWAGAPLKDFHQTINIRACAQSGCLDGNIPQLS